MWRRIRRKGNGGENGGKEKRYEKVEGNGGEGKGNGGMGRIKEKGEREGEERGRENGREMKGRVREMEGWEGERGREKENEKKEEGRSGGK
jgi:hypothetical protein